MNEFISFVLPFGALLLAVAVLLTKDPKTSKRLTVAAGAAALAGGLVIYGYGYVAQSGNYLQGLLHAIFPSAVCLSAILTSVSLIMTAPACSHLHGWSR